MNKLWQISKKKLRQLHRDSGILQQQKLEELTTKVEERILVCALYHTSVLIIFPKPGYAYGDNNRPGIPSNMMYSVCSTDTSMREYITNGIQEKYKAEGSDVKIAKDGDITISGAY